MSDFLNGALFGAISSLVIVAGFFAMCYRSPKYPTIRAPKPLRSDLDDSAGTDW